MTEILAIVMSVGGSLVLIVVGVCAYLLKNLMASNHRIELGLTKLISEHDSLDFMVRGLMVEVKELREKIHKIERQSTH